jgi:hypothetical protein
MTVSRAAALLLTFAVIALTVIHLRAEQMRAAARIHNLELAQRRLHQNAWELQMRIAQLKTPDQIRDRVERWRLNVLAPCPGPGWRTDTSLAGAGRP